MTGQWGVVVGGGKDPHKWWFGGGGIFATPQGPQHCVWPRGDCSGEGPDCKTEALQYCTAQAQTTVAMLTCYTAEAGASAALWHLEKNPQLQSANVRFPDTQYTTFGRLRKLRALPGHQQSSACQPPR